MEQEQPPSRAEQRMAAVAKLKRAASLPRMKDGRRPPMHAEAVSDGEKNQNGEEVKDEASNFATSEGVVDVVVKPDVVEPGVETGGQPEAEIEAEQDVEAEDVEGTLSPGPSTRSKRRSRSRSRSRGSKDFKGKVRCQTPTPTPQTTGDSSQDEAPRPPPLNLATLTPLISPLPSHILELQRSRLLRSPISPSPEPLNNNSPLPHSPVLLPTLEAWQRGLFRSNSAGGTNSAGRMMAMHKLTGGTETYDPPGSPSPTPPPFSKLSRNNTVTGGERSAARQLMLSRLGGRIGKEVDGEQGSGGEERSAPSPTPKRRRRRSRRGSQSVNTAVSDSEFLSTTPNTPTVPPTPLPVDSLPDLPLRSQSATPFQLANFQSRELEELLEPVQQAGPLQEQEPQVENERPEPVRRRSVVVEEDEEEPQYLPLRTYPVLPALMSVQGYNHTPASKLSNTLDTPFNVSPEPSSSSALNISVLMSQRTPQRNPLANPYVTPLREVLPRDDDEEQVLYQPDLSRSRTPFMDNLDREISWIATPVPELEVRMPVHDDEEDELSNNRDEEQYQDDEPPVSPQSSNSFSPPEHHAYDDVSPHISPSSKSVVVESETSPTASPSHVSLAHSAAVPSQSASLALTSDGSASPSTYPKRLSVASRSPLYGEFPDWDERSGNADTHGKRIVDGPSTWEKVKSTFTRAGSSSGRRSRTNSIVTRDRRDRSDSINRESGASINSAKTDRVDTSTQPQTQQPVMQSLSASASISSLSPHVPGRGGPSPIPPLTPANKSKYQHAKLFPFGMTSEEQRNRLPSASASSPDIILQSSSNEEDHPPFIPDSSHPQAREPLRERKISHQTSDTHLVAKFNAVAPATLNPDTQSRSPPHNKLPMTVSGVKQWLSKNKKLFASAPSSSVSTPVIEGQSLPGTKQSPALDSIQRKDSEQLSTEWEEAGNTPTTTNGEFPSAGPNDNPEVLSGARNVSHLERVDAEKTLKPKKAMIMTMPPSDQRDINISFFDESPLSPPSRPDPFSSATPDPSSSLSDYPAHSTSESSSTTSSQYSLTAIPPQGSLFIEKIDEELARGSRSRIWATSIDDPPRKLLLATPVFQVVDHNTLKDRFLFLFSDILVIAKPVFMDQEAYVDKDPIGRKFIIKSVVMLNHMRFTDGRADVDTKEVKARNRLVASFVHNFSKDPDSATNSLYVRSGREEDPVAVGQLLFKTVELDRVRLGEYLAKRTAKTILRVYLDSFGFSGLRIDKALRVFLLSIYLPSKISHHQNALEYFLEAFAGRWYEANAKKVDYNKDHAHRFVRAIVQLNDLLHGGIASQPGLSKSPQRDVTSDEFVDAFRRYDQKSSVPDGLLRDVYESILHERLTQSPSSGNTLESIVIKRAIPACLTWRIESEPIVLRIPHPDPNLNVELYGQDLIFDPPTLNFGRSPEVSFRVKAVSLGSKSIIMCRTGLNALKYTGLPLSSPVLVERAFMRHTLQVAFENHHGLKRRYMFSMDDSVLRHQWAAHIRRQMEKAVETSKAGMSKFKRAAETVAFRILQETLIGPSMTSSSATQKSPQRANIYPLNLGGVSRVTQDRGGTVSNPLHTASLHVRSKSRSKVYHQHGAGKNELDFSQPLRLHDEDEDVDDVERNEGPLWSTEELKVICEQNSTIASLLAYLQALFPEKTDDIRNS